MSSADATRPSTVPAAVAKPAWRLNAVLFVATLAAVFVTALDQNKDKGESLGLAMSHGTYVKAFEFVGSIMLILVAHELGHYIAARIHKVEASLPFFIPMPFLSPFGTMGAVIRMRGTIPTRRALLDIGASGPLAGMVFAIPLYIWGVQHSEIIPFSGPADANMVELGESVLVKVLDHFFVPNIPDGMTVNYSPVAFGAWGGMFVTMINLLPLGQLDGGHVAYALFGPRQDKLAITVHRAMLVFFGVIVAGHVMRDVSAHRVLTVAVFSAHIANALFWLVWFQVLSILGTLARPRPAENEEEGEEAERTPMLTWRTRVFAMLGLAALASIGREHPSLPILGSFIGGLGLLIAMEIKGGVLRKHELLVHPPTGPEPLDTKRKVVAIFTLVLFALLFMPEPFSF